MSQQQNQREEPIDPKNIDIEKQNPAIRHQYDDFGTNLLAYDIPKIKEEMAGSELNIQTDKQRSGIVETAQQNKYLNYITEGNEAKDPNAGQIAILDTSQDYNNLLNHQRLDTDVEPHGSQAFQYHGHFTPFIPPVLEPLPPLPDHQGASNALLGFRNQPEQPEPLPENEPIQAANPQPPAQPSWIPFLDLIRKLLLTYDKPFIVLLGIQNINHGLWSVAILACQDLYKQYLGLNPGTMTLYMSIIHIPWSIKILYGLISDNVPIAGTRRKSYIILMGLLQFFALISIYFLHETSALLVAIFLTAAALSEAFVNVVADAIMCVQARKDPIHGSQDLIAFSWMASGIGGIIGSVLGGVMTQYFHPRYSFLCYSFFGLIVALNGSYLTQESEEDSHEEGLQNEHDALQESFSSLHSHNQVVLQNGQQQEEQSEFWKKFKRNIREIGRAIMMPEIYLVVIFFVLNGIISPDFGDFGYYFMLNVVKVSKFQYSMLGVIGQITGIFGTMYYENYLKDIEVRTVLYWSTIVSMISSFCQYAFARRWNKSLGINDMFFIIMTDTIFGVISLAMNTLPTLALFAKITPAKIEGTVFAFLTGTTNLANNVLAPMIGVWINEQFIHVTADNLSNYKQLCLVGFITSFLGFLILPLIPLKKDIEFYQIERIEAKIRAKKEKQARESNQILKENEQNQILKDNGPIEIQKDNQPTPQYPKHEEDADRKTEAHDESDHLLKK